MKMTKLSFDEQLKAITLLANEHSDVILESLGISVGRHGRYQGICPVHGGDNNHGFSWHDGKKIWACWTQHCHKRYGGGILGLISGVNKCTIKDSMEYVTKLLSKELENIDIDELYLRNFIKNKIVTNIKPVYLDAQFLTSMPHNVEYFLNRGFQQSTLSYFQTFQCDIKNHPLNGRSVIPVFDIDTKLVGFTGRNHNTDYSKWKNYPDTYEKSKHLYGLNMSKNVIKRSKIAVLTEGPLDVWRAYEAGIKNVVATQGNSISYDQVKLLLQQGVVVIVTLFDPDNGGSQAVQQITDNFGHLFEIKNLQQYLTDDLGDLSVEFIKENITPKIEEIEKETKMRYNL